MHVITSFLKVFSEAGGKLEFAEGLFGIQMQTQAISRALRSLLVTLESVKGFI
jgi:hypothetical protein